MPYNFIDLKKDFISSSRKDFCREVISDNITSLKSIMIRSAIVRTSLCRSTVTALVIVTFLVFSVNHVPGVEGSATPKGMREIFIGRCEEFQEVIYPEAFVSQ